MNNRDKGRDDEFFDWNQDHEIEYVASQFGTFSEEVKTSLLFYKGLHQGQLPYMTHREVYKMIEDRFGYRRVQ